jgi:preprotein translocase subunit SecB
MTKKYKILGKYIKDMSSETPDIETYVFVRDNISKYQLNIDINSKALKNKMIEINTILRFEDKQDNKKKSYFEINFSTIIKVEEETKDKKELEKSLLNLLHDSGYPDVKFEKKVDFEQLYIQRLN